MNLWLSSCFLVAGLFLSSSALTPEECRPLITPLSLTPSVVYGKFHFLSGYSDNDVYNHLLKLTDSYWLNANASPSGPDTVAMSSGSRVNGTCISLSINGTIDGNTLSTSVGTVASLHHLLPTCAGCQLMSINGTATDMDKMLRMMNIKSNATAERMNVRALYLMANGTAVKDSDLEHFREQARCLGFTGEPDFTYDPKNELCGEGEGLKMFTDQHHS